MKQNRHLGFEVADRTYILQTNQIVVYGDELSYLLNRFLEPLLRQAG